MGLGPGGKGYHYPSQGSYVTNAKNIGYEYIPSVTCTYNLD